MIDFKEVPDGGEVWEQFARDFLAEIGFQIETPPDRGADRGKGFLVTERLVGNVNTYPFRWLVSCKHFAKSNKAVSEKDEANIRERLESFRADGFLGFYSTLPSSGLNSRLMALRNEAKIRDYRIFDSREIENRLIRVGYSKLMMRYLPEGYKRTRPLHLLMGKYEPLPCDVCGKDLLEELHRKDYQAIIVLDSTHDEKYTKRFVHDLFWVCKGDCDRKISARIRSTRNHVDSWEDISDLDIPLKFLGWIFANLNTIRSGETVYEEEAFDRLKHFIGAMAQRVFSRNDRIGTRASHVFARLAAWNLGRKSQSLSSENLFKSQRPRISSRAVVLTSKFMPIPPHAVAAAQAVQHRAAQDPSNAVRLIAGPGTGKSSSIEQRVYWLLTQQVAPRRIFVVSFTRASTRDLRDRVRRYCEAKGQAGAVDVQVSTLHSLALRTLRRAGLLGRYPADPLVLDDWELTNIFDPEFGENTGINSKRRREQIRYYHEAYWSTGVFLPPNYLPPDPPISDRESTLFLNFHGPTSQVYSCVLPGEIIRQCVHEMDAGHINPVELLQIEHLIVDEFQDLNPMDLNFVDGLVTGGASVFIAGDDDQSIYSFRFANPSGMQTFPARHAGTSSHMLDECFRCMPEVLNTAAWLMLHFGAPHRIPKNLTSLYRHCAPASQGHVHRWRFLNGTTEARAVAQSCAALIQGGLSPADILILLDHQPALSPGISDELTAVNVPFDAGQSDDISDTSAGRLALALLRIVGNGNDYVAHRTVLGVRRGVGVGTTDRIRTAVVHNNLNYRDLFYHPLPPGVFTGRTLAALTSARDVCNQLAQWDDADALAVRAADFQALINQAVGADEATAWQQFVATMPQEITLKELRDVLWAANDEQRCAVITAVYERIQQPMPEQNIIPPRVKVLTMHGAKGLSAPVVFIPGLEDQLLPGPRRAAYPGLILEAARLLYVSITRARTTCIASYASRRFINGRTQTHIASRFAAHIGGAFVNRGQALTVPEVQLITTECLTI
jgi:DNA helicase II / ATP-dependent DNA helicase PcrA